MATLVQAAGQEQAVNLDRVLFVLKQDKKDKPHEIVFVTRDDEGVIWVFADKKRRDEVWSLLQIRMI